MFVALIDGGIVVVVGQLAARHCNSTSAYAGLSVCLVIICLFIKEINSALFY